MLKEILNQKIKDASLEDLKQKLDYQSLKKLEKSLNNFLKTKTINEWLNSGFYDLVNNAAEFYIKLCKAFEIDDMQMQKELNDFTNHKGLLILRLLLFLSF